WSVIAPQLPSGTMYVWACAAGAKVRTIPTAMRSIISVLCLQSLATGRRRPTLRKIETRPQKRGSPDSRRAALPSKQDEEIRRYREKTRWRNAFRPLGPFGGKAKERVCCGLPGDRKSIHSRRIRFLKEQPDGEAEAQRPHRRDFLSV